MLQLRKCGLSKKEHVAGKAIGYQQALDFLDNIDNNRLENSIEIDTMDRFFNSFLNEFQSASRQYSRRQDVWFKKNPKFHWCHWELFQSNTEDMTRFITEMFLLDNEDFDCNEILLKIHQESLDKRFDASVEKNMRTFKTKLTIYDDPNIRRQLFEDIKNQL